MSSVEALHKVNMDSSSYQRKAFDQRVRGPMVGILRNTNGNNNTHYKVPSIVSLVITVMTPLSLQMLLPPYSHLWVSESVP